MYCTCTVRVYVYVRACGSGIRGRGNLISTLRVQPRRFWNWKSTWDNVLPLGHDVELLKRENGLLALGKIGIS